MIKYLCMTLALLLCCALPVSAQALPDGRNYQWVEVVGGFDNPLGVTHAGDERLFGIEQLGRIWVIEDGAELFDPFLDISHLLSADVFSGAYSERGLLGLAFHPNYQENGLFFIHYTDMNGNTQIVRYQVSADNPNLADPQSATTILSVVQPFANHNGGQLAFGPDGYLYIGLGDGGDQGDPFGNAQNPNSLLGKILRIDINAPFYTVPEDNPFVGYENMAPEIWALGLRNPWRFSFDRETGDLYIADVGEWVWEEVNVQPADSRGGENYGWEYFEATEQRDPVVPNFRFIPPSLTYAHNEGCSISGGYVYRGQALPALQGIYFYGDYCSGKMWAARRGDVGEWQSTLFMETTYQISSFGEDVNGELYLVDYKGEIYQLTAAG